MQINPITSIRFPPVKRPAPKATIGGLDKTTLIIKAGINFLNGVLVNPMA